jgi:hypothetical protein
MAIRIVLSDPEIIKKSTYLSGIANNLNRYFEVARHMLSRVGLERALYNLTVEANPSPPSSIKVDVIAQYDDYDDLLRIFLLAIDKHRNIAPHAIVHECGHRYWNKFLTPGKRKIWADKYIQVSPRAIAVINKAAWTNTNKDYHSFVAQFRDNYTRLVALHLVNALMANKVPIEMLNRIDFRRHPATKDFASGSRSFSLTPLISMYASKDVYEDFAETFRAYVESGGTLRSINDPNGRRMLLYIFQQVIS